mgnify:FL=1
MKKTYTSIQDLFIIEPKIFSDDRGYFMESFKDNWFKKEFPEIKFIQDNESKSTYGILRGLHFQKPPFSQTKLVRVVKGKVLDIAVDLRKKSKTYGKFESIILSDENKKQLLVPKGFAHGFLVLSKVAIFSYKVDNIYSKDHDSGIIWNSKDLNIDWNISTDHIKVSEKDNNLQYFNQFNSPF